VSSTSCTPAALARTRWKSATCVNHQARIQGKGWRYCAGIEAILLTQTVLYSMRGECGEALLLVLFPSTVLHPLVPDMSHPATAQQTPTTWGLPRWMRWHSKWREAYLTCPLEKGRVPSLAPCSLTSPPCQPVLLLPTCPSPASLSFTCQPVLLLPACPLLASLSFSCQPVLLLPACPSPASLSFSCQPVLLLPACPLLASLSLSLSCEKAKARRHCCCLQKETESLPPFPSPLLPLQADSHKHWALWTQLRLHL